MDTDRDAREVLDPISRGMDIGTSTAVGGATQVEGLSRGALGLTGVTMQAITHIAPAIAAFFFTSVVVGFAGVTAPLAYLVGVLIVLMLGSSLVQLAKHLPSAGAPLRGRHCARPASRASRAEASARPWWSSAGCVSEVGVARSAIRLGAA